MMKPQYSEVGASSQLPIQIAREVGVSLPTGSVAPPDLTPSGPIEINLASRSLWYLIATLENSSPLICI